jgi:hypothetical protein
MEANPRTNTTVSIRTLTIAEFASRVNIPENGTAIQRFARKGLIEAGNERFLGGNE